MNMQAGLAVVADRNISNRTQDLALLADLDLLVALRCKIQPADGRLPEGTDRCERSRRDFGFVGESRQRGKRLLARIEDDDVNLSTWLFRYKLASHARRPQAHATTQAAL